MVLACYVRVLGSVFFLYRLSDTTHHRRLQASCALIEQTILMDSY